MDFSIIEGLTEEELNECYEKDIINNGNINYISGVKCCYYANPYSCKIFGGAYSGACPLLVEHIRYYEESVDWCNRLNAYVDHYVDSCYCARYGQDFYGFGYWQLCTR